MKRKYMYIFILICIFLLTSCGEKTTDLSSNLYTENNDIHSFVLNELNLNKEDISYSSYERLWENEYIVTLISNDNEYYIRANLNDRSIENLDLVNSNEISTFSYTLDTYYYQALEKAQLDENDILKAKISSLASFNTKAIDVSLYTANMKYYYSFNKDTNEILNYRISLIDYDSENSAYISMIDAITRAKDYIGSEVELEEIRDEKLRGNKVYIISLYDLNKKYEISINALTGDIIKEEQRSINSKKIFINKNIIDEKSITNIVYQNIIDNININYISLVQGFNRTNFVYRAYVDTDYFTYKFEINGLNGTIISKEKYIHNYYDFIYWAYNYQNKNDGEFESIAQEKYNNGYNNIKFTNIISENNVLDIINNKNINFNTNYLCIKLDIINNSLAYIIYGNDEVNFFYFYIDAYNGNIISEHYTNIDELVTITRNAINVQTKSSSFYSIDFEFIDNKLYYYVYGMSQCYSFIVRIDDETKEYLIIEKNYEDSINKCFITKDKALIQALNYCLLTIDDVSSIKVKLNDYNIHNAYIVSFRRIDVTYEIEIDVYTGKLLNYRIKYLD